MLIQERTYKEADDPAHSSRLLTSVYYSVWCYLLLAVCALIFGVDRAYVEGVYRHHNANPAELFWRGALAVFAPAFTIATTTRLWNGRPSQQWLFRQLRMYPRHQQPTAWDYFFRQRHNVYVRVTNKDGGRVLGFYGAESFAAYAKTAEICISNGSMSRTARVVWSRSAGTPRCLGEGR